MPRLAVRASAVTRQTPLGGPYHLTAIEAPELAGAVAPGQFVMLREPGIGDPLLGRPFSVFGVERDEGGNPARVTLLYNVVGKGTGLLAARQSGEPVLLLGPLGTAYALDPLPRRALLVAGGIGIAGLHLLAARLTAARVPVRLLYGARSDADLVTADRFEALGVEVEVATDDGSRGHKGFVTALLAEELARPGAKEAVAYVCGPSVMMRRVREMTLAAGLRTELSLEARMGCGFGVCLGCAVPSATVPGTFRMVCKDGPCMDAREVLP